MGQYYHLQTTSAPSRLNNNLQIESLNSGSYCIAGYTEPVGASKGFVFVRYYNKCGEELWSLELEDSIKTLILSDLDVDSSQNLILSGYIDKASNSPTPYLMKIDTNGSLIQSFKVGSRQGLNMLHYSSSIGANGELFVYGLHNYSTSPPDNATLFTCKIENNQIVWAKNIDFTNRTWGSATATKDGGLIGRTVNTLFKLNNQGGLEWTRDYNSIGTLRSPVEIDSGYVMFKFYIGAIDRFYAFLVRRDGTLGWKTNVFYNFTPAKMSIGHSGNPLFIGTGMSSIGSMTLLELDQSNGQTIAFKELNANNVNGSDICKGIDNSYHTVAREFNMFIPQIMHGRLDINLNAGDCQFINLSESSNPVNITVSNNNPLTLSNNTDIEVQNYQPIYRIMSPGISFTYLCGNSSPVGDAYQLGRDTILCPKATLLLGEPNSNYNSYLWSNGSNSKTITVSQAGTYWLEVEHQCESFRDSIQIKYYPEIGLNLGSDTSLCQGDSILLQVKGLPNYLWSDGSTNDSLWVKQTDWYWLETLTNCGPVRDSIFITLLPKNLPTPDLGTDQIICPEDTLFISSSVILPNYLWSTGDTVSAISVSDSGLYWLETKNQCDTTRDSVHIAHQAIPNHKIEQINDANTVGDSFFFRIDTASIQNIQWSVDNNTFGGDTLSYVFTKPGSYLISLTANTKNSCILRDQLLVDVQDIDVAIPNVFTPNSDGINDFFRPIHPGIHSYQLQIFDRWGHSVFESNSSAWIGQNNSGHKLSEGVYSYIIEIEYLNGLKSLHQGEVSLMR